MQNRTTVCVTEAYARVYNVPSDFRWQSFASRFAWPFTRRIQDIKHALPGSARGLEHLIQAVQPGYRIVKQTKIKQEADQLPHRHSSGKHLPPSGPENQYHAQGSGKAHRWRIRSPYLHYSKGSCAQGCGSFRETFVFVLFPPEGFDCSYSLEVVHQQGIHSASRLPLTTIAAMGRQSVP